MNYFTNQCGNRTNIRAVEAVSVPGWASWTHLIRKLWDTKQSTQLSWIWESWTHKSFLLRSPCFISAPQVKCPVLETVDYYLLWPYRSLTKSTPEGATGKVYWSKIETTDCYFQPDFNEKRQSSLLLRKQSRLKNDVLRKSTNFDFWQLIFASYYMWQLQTWRVKAVFLPKKSQPPKQRPRKHEEKHFSLQHTTGSSPKPICKPKIWEDCARP